ncbi:MAG TPA: DUF2382 domain-containing protein [Gemmatimonadaceae bacterium]|nr:DUF2382 domain-containing protein [Gemmatimonadaceae bacterium]
MADNDRNMTPGGLVPLDKADDYKIADGNPDPRGWDVIANGKKVGEVDKLIADLSALKVRYLDVELDKDFAGTKDRHVLIPIGAARLDDDNDKVLLQGMTRDALIGLPAFAANTPITRDYENSLRERMTGAPVPAPRSGRDYYDHEHFDENRFFGRRGTPESGEHNERLVRIPITEEEMRVGKRQVQAGEVDVRKTVETKHMEQPVTRRREEVEVERRPIQGDQPVTGTADFKEGETRIPLMEEEVVVEKRPVAKEEVVIRKHAVEDTENVSADLRKERVDIDEKGRVRGKMERDHDRDADEKRRAR